MTGEAARHWRSATTVTAEWTAHGHGPAPRRQTHKQGMALTAIHPQQCRPEPAPLHAREDDSGDTGR